MPDLKSGVNRIADNAMREFRDDYQEAWEKLAEDVRPVVIQAMTDLSEEYVNLVMFPDESGKWARNIAHVKGTLTNVSALVQIRAYERIRKSIQRVMQTLVTIMFEAGAS